MSSLEGKLTLNLSVGLELHAVLKVNAQVHGGEKVIFDAGPLLGGPRFKVCLDERDDLVLVLTDLEGHDHVSPSVSGAEVAKPVHLTCSACPTGGETRISISINDVERASRQVKANFGHAREVLTALGTDVRGQNAAAFTLSELAIFSSCLPPSVRHRLHKGFKARYALA